MFFDNIFPVAQYCSGLFIRFTMEKDPGEEMQILLWWCQEVHLAPK